MKNRKPIQPTLRGEKFFTGDDFLLENELGKEYFTDLNHQVKVYNVDYKKTKANFYGETKASEKVVHPPVTINCRATVESSETKYLSGSGMKKEWAGNLTITTYNSELEENNIEIRIGDYLGYLDSKNKTERYYEVSSNNILNNANQNTHLGKESYWRKIIAVSVEQDVFVG